MMIWAPNLLEPQSAPNVQTEVLSHPAVRVIKNFTVLGWMFMA